MIKAMNRLTSAFLFVSILLLAACAPSPEPPPTPSIPPTHTSPPPASMTPEIINELPLFNARVDLANRLGTAPEQVEILSVEAVEWPDSSLGCALPGGVYLTVITPGYRLTLSALGETYTYHTDLQGNVVLCSQEGLPLPPPLPLTPDDIQDGDPWIPVGTPPPN